MSNLPYIRCQRCRELKPRAEFADKLTNRTGKRGVCLTCEPPEPEPVKPGFTPAVVHAMCSKKRRYGSKAVAFRYALRSARRAERIRVYECPICKGFHLTHKEARAS